MRGIFWNSRGLKDLAKRRFLAETALEQKLDFVALSETGRDNFAPSFSPLWLVVLISIGIASLREEDRVVSY